MASFLRFGTKRGADRGAHYINCVLQGTPPLEPALILICNPLPRDPRYCHRAMLHWAFAQRLPLIVGSVLESLVRVLPFDCTRCGRVTSLQADVVCSREDLDCMREHAPLGIRRQVKAPGGAIHLPELEPLICVAAIARSIDAILDRYRPEIARVVL